MAELFISGAMLSHAGLVRSHNEDSVLYYLPRGQERSRTLGALALVADGMGGHAAGEIASELASRVVHAEYYRQARPIPTALSEALFAANAAICRESAANPERSGMGTTCTVLAMCGNCAWLAHIGDSRAYIVRNGEIRQISEDHSLVASLVRSGAMSPSEAAQSPERNVILQALGTRFDIEPQIWDRGLPLQTGDALILCTDGLTDLVDEVAIATIVATTAPFEACQALIDAALAAGGHDNISVGVFSVADEPKAPDAERPTRTTDLRALAGEPP